MISILQDEKDEAAKHFAKVYAQWQKLNIEMDKLGAGTDRPLTQEESYAYNVQWELYDKAIERLAAAHNAWAFWQSKKQKEWGYNTFPKPRLVSSVTIGEDQ
jgi:hypothetical protein